MVGEAGFHRWRDPQGLMYPAEIVVGKMQSTTSFQIVQLLRERIGQAREASDRLANRHILALDVACAYVARVRTPVAYLDYGFYHRCGRVPSSGVVLPVVTIQLYHLCEVGLSSKHIFNALAVEVEAVCRDLYAVLWRDAITQAGKELIRSFAVALPDCVGGNQLRFGVQGHKHPSVTELYRVAQLYIALLLSAECPDFIALNPLAAKILHSRVHQLYTALTCENKQAHDRVSVQPCNALCAANTGAFNQKLNRQKCTVFGNCHRTKQPRMFFGKGPAALRAAEPLQTIAVLTKLPASDVARGAFHVQ